MADKPLFYENICVLDRDTHADLKLDTSETRFGFAAKAHLIPALIDEFVPAGRVLPIVFIPGAPRATPVFLTGLHPGHNRFVDDEGRWTASYLPAFVRRYPFVIGEMEKRDPVVCIDDQSALLSKEGGEPLFLENGDQSPILQNTVRFVGEYMAAAKRTEAFVDVLQEHDLFRTITIDVRIPNGDTKTLHGTMTIDVARFNALPEKAFLSLRTTGALPAIFAQISSLQGLEKLADVPTAGVTA